MHYDAVVGIAVGGADADVVGAGGWWLGTAFLAGATDAFYKVFVSLGDTSYAPIAEYLVIEGTL